MRREGAVFVGLVLAECLAGDVAAVLGFETAGNGKGPPSAADPAAEAAPFGEVASACGIDGLDVLLISIHADEKV